MNKELLERIKELRTMYDSKREIIHSAGILKCKQALIESDLDIEKAVIWLKKRGYFGMAML